MNKTTLALLALTMGATAAMADVNVIVTPQPDACSINVTKYPISCLVNGDRSLITEATYTLSNGALTFETDTVPAMYMLNMSNSENTMPVQVFAAPDETVYVLFYAEADGENYKGIAKGTQLMDGIDAMQEVVAPIEDVLMLANYGMVNLSQEELETMQDQLTAFYEDYMDMNSDNPAAAYALLNIEDNDQFLDYASDPSEGVKNSILYPLVEKRINGIKEEQERETRLEQLQSGEVDAPAFTLPNQKGKKVSLSQFKGKWVVLDFWGTWCRWCIKGIPDMKEAYAKYKGKAEFIGIDCGDSKEAWLEGLKQYQMPWVHVYNESNSPEAKKLTEAYGVAGYPTKVIISPKGKIVKIVVGEDPEFYKLLEELIK